jgi:hypothetical protein
MNWNSMMIDIFQSLSVRNVTCFLLSILAMIHLTIQAQKRPNVNYILTDQWRSTALVMLVRGFCKLESFRMFACIESYAVL